ncbi:MauE/DoxX family redox-associated membrane protein [Epilithonimonas vandammei]|uniref:MauE/DoxX family redox-associated membrane protein n=1 Tax=Epilithonimonas vandammei TaxID=2487072 RepID=UPI0028B1C6FF|nr:MauE/DoxX family redox-associated membrane protein [Epilithonimonas vandammei]
MKRLLFIFTEVISYFFIVLFLYASVSKILDFKNFQVQIAQSPLLSSYAGMVSYLVIIIELMIVAILLFPKSRHIGLYYSLGIMSAFTMYIYLILEYSEFVPCSCGGILENMSWRTHFIFNAICVIILMIAICLSEAHRNQKAKKYISVVSVIVILSSLSVFLLYIKSENQLRKNNNFTRRYIPHVLKDEVRLNINYNSFYFIGQDKNNIYLGNTTAPLNLTIVKKDLQSFSKFRIPLDTKSHSFKSLRVTFQLPYYYIYDGTVPIIYKSSLNQADSLRTVSLNDMYFDQLNVISDTSFLFRSQSSKFKTFVIGTYQDHQFDLNYDILGTQDPGYIENDGLLISDFDKKNFLYLYYYKNEFTVVNNITHQQNKFKLISFNKKKKTETVKLPDGSNKIKNPLQQSVKNAAVYGNLLFVNSNSKATHDGIMQWNKASIIDMYKINQQYYSGSFLIPDSHGEKVKDMLVAGEYIYILIGNEIVKYHFAQPILDEFRR